MSGAAFGGLGRRLRLGMIGGGQGAFIGAVHRIAARLDDRYELVAGALCSDPERARASAVDLGIAPDRAYPDFATMAAAEAARADGAEVVAIVTPNHLHAPAALACLTNGLHVICDKPLTASVAEADALVRAVAASGCVFAVTYNYTGYPMVRQARAMIADGAIGAVRVIQVEYPQDWLTERLEAEGQKQAAWRTDPAQAGAGGCIGDIGTHAFHLAEFVTGLTTTHLLADLDRFVPGRLLDDNAQLLLRFAGGARGMLWASQVAPGNENALRLRVYGDRGGIEWAQEHPNQLRVTRLGEPPAVIARGAAGSDAAAGAATRIPSGHPEGYLEAFAQLYREAADAITAKLLGRPGPESAALLPGVAQGARGLRFVEAAVRSSQRDAIWVEISA
jgi:predicted dehydrogenase